MNERSSSGRTLYITARGVALGLVMSLAMGCNQKVDTKIPVTPATGIRYVAIGDSYTAGTPYGTARAWPTLLAADLTRNGIPTQVVANPAESGWTTQQAIELELPVFEASRPEFGTLMIGVNDWAQKVDGPTFRKRIGISMTRMQVALPDKKRLILMTIPAFYVTRRGTMYAMQRENRTSIGEVAAVKKKVALDIKKYNSIIV